MKLFTQRDIAAVVGQLTASMYLDWAEMGSAGQTPADYYPSVHSCWVNEYTDQWARLIDADSLNARLNQVSVAMAELGFTY